MAYCALRRRRTSPIGRLTPTIADTRNPLINDGVLDDEGGVSTAPLVTDGFAALWDYHLVFTTARV
jgi:hypothetical protein